MMTSPPAAKRPRLSCNVSGSNSTVLPDGPDPNNVVSSPTTVSSDDVVSSSRPTPTAETSSFSTNENNLVFTTDTPPISDNMDTTLCVISNKKEKYSKHEILQALKDLVRWAANNNREFYNESLELAGIARILKFLMVPKNMSDMEYINLICTVIASCTYIGTIGNRDIAEVMANKFIDRGGVHTMLLSDDEYTGGNDDKELLAVNSIREVLGNVVSNRTAFDDIEKNK
jgi:hypothetical protein